MIESKNLISLVPSCWRHGAIALITCLFLSGFAAGQDLPASISNPVPQLPTAPSVQLKAQFPPAYQGETGKPQQAGENRAFALRAADSEPDLTPTGARLITLEEAQE